jgi:DNA polymerase-3 subunit epsilon
MPWPDPPALCTVALARRFAPLVRRRALGPLAGSLGIDQEGAHRALVDAETCARVFCALFARLCANAATVGDALQALRPRKVRMRPKGAKRPRKERPDLSSLPKDPGVYVFRDADGRPLYVGKSVCVRTRARSHFTTPATWTGQAAHVDYEATESELGALVLENRLIKALKPSGNVRGKRTADGYAYLRCRLDIAFPILEVGREPAPGHSVTVGPVQGTRALSELVEQLNSLFGLRHCGRTLHTRPWPSAYGQMGRCLSPCLGDLDPNLYRERLDDALNLFVAEPDGGAATGVSPRCSAASAASCARSTRAHGSSSRRIPRTRPASTPSGSPAAGSLTGVRWCRCTSSPRAHATRSKPPAEAGSPRTRSRRRGSSAPGSRRTIRLLWSSAWAWGSPSTRRSLSA